MGAILRLMKIQEHSLPVLASMNGGRWDATLHFEFTRGVNVRHVTSWLACEGNNIRYAEMSNIRPLLSSDRQQNEAPELMSVSNFILRSLFGFSVGWNRSISNFFSFDVCIRKRCNHWINMNNYTTNQLDSNRNIYSPKHRNFLPFSRWMGGESAGRICGTRVAVMISSCIERTQGFGCEFEIFTVPVFPASWNCNHLCGILTFSRNPCRTHLKSTPEDSKHPTCDFVHSAYTGPWFCLFKNEG
jgi:hypothetical protein